MPQNYKQTIKQSVLNQETFVRLTFKGHIRGTEIELPWRRVVIRPVLIKQVRHLQFSYFDEKKDITKNYRDGEAEQKLDEVLDLPFSSIVLQSTAEDIQVQIPKQGKVILHRNKPTQALPQPDLSHDTSKNVPLPANKPDAFLETIGIMDTQGKVIPRMADKFSQINEYLKLLEHTGELEHFRQENRTIHMLDCGCGSAYLSFATYHYLNDVQKIPTELVGIDVNLSLIEKSNTHSQELGFDAMCFRHSAIIDYQPAVPPDIILALHACDTATDESIAQGILNNSRLILSVPCCHHHLHEQVKIIAPFQPVFQDGILKKRIIDILTDTFRALILRMTGYKTDVIEFVSSEHTDRNLMIRAVKHKDEGYKKYLKEYEELKKFWDVTPYLETLLRERGRWPEED